MEKRTRIIAQFAACFRDHRKAERIEHGVKELVAQRVYGLALGYEDLNDHEELRRDPLLAVLVEKPDPRGEKRARERDRGKALAGKSTLNRLELSEAEAGSADPRCWGPRLFLDSSWTSRRPKTEVRAPIKKEQTLEI